MKQLRLLTSEPLLAHEFSNEELPAFLCADWDLLEFPLSSGIVFAVISNDIQPGHDEISRGALLMNGDSIIVFLKICLVGVLVIGSTAQAQCTLSWQWRLL